MAELLAPADVESGIVALLDSALTADVSTEVPHPRPSDEQYVRVTSAGGTIRNLIQLDARCLIECWSPDESDALNLARHAWALLNAAQDSYLAGSGVYPTRIDSGAPVNFPDPDTKHYRYQFLTTVTTSLQEFS